MSTNNTWTEETFMAHVGAPSFHEAVEVMLRTKAQNEANIEEKFNRIKAIGRDRDQLTERVKEQDAQLAKVTAQMNAAVNSWRASEAGREESKARLAETWQKLQQLYKAIGEREGFCRDCADSCTDRCSDGMPCYLQEYALERLEQTQQQLAQANTELASLRQQAVYDNEALTRFEQNGREAELALAQANEQLAGVKADLEVATQRDGELVTAYERMEKQLAGEAAKCHTMGEALIGIRQCLGTPGIARYPEINRLTTALWRKPSAALQRYGLEVAFEAWKESAKAVTSGAPYDPASLDSALWQRWMNSQTRASVAGKEEA